MSANTEDILVYLKSNLLFEVCSFVCIWELSLADVYVWDHKTVSGLTKQKSPLQSNMLDLYRTLRIYGTDAV